MKIVFMGTPAFAVPSLKACIEHHEVLAVYTQPDKPKGRGKKMAMSEVKIVALEQEIPVFQPVKLKEASSVEALKSLSPDVIVVVAYGQILSQEILDIPKFGCVNVHGSLLPKHRGAAPIQWSVANGDKETGITTMLMDRGIDTGDMLLKKSLDIPPHATALDMEIALAQMGADLLIKTLEGLESGTITPTPQDHTAFTYAEILTKEIANIDWSMPAAKIESRVRGFNPWPVTFSHYQNEVLKIFKAEVIEGLNQGLVGEIIDVDKKSFTVQTGSGALRVLEIQMGSQKRMTTQAYLLGRTLEKGIVLSQIKEA